MNLTFQGISKDLMKGILELESQLGFKVIENGLPVRVEKTVENVIEVRLVNNQGAIRYCDDIHFFRALGLFIEATRNQTSFEIKEEPQFKMNGAMFDCSRNGVLKPETVKTFIRYMATMGLNMLMLYTEDTYTIESEPYFGYLRGRYTNSELKEIDDYAYSFGIEVIPCIQTLAHLSSYLRWSHTANIQDTEDVLLIRNKETYNFIDKMIQSAASPFRTNRIHIGMDEAHGLGRGKFLDRFGKEDRFNLMTQHLKEVMKITNKLELKPMVWSDMYFRVWSETNAYYDLDINIPKEVVRDIPKGVQLVYWDYYNEKEDFYINFIQKHADFGSKPVFAGGIWTWNGPTIHYEKTFNTTNAALSACKQENVKEVFATLWGDDGSESNYFFALLGLQLFAEHGYSKTIDSEKVKRRFEFCTGGDFNAFLALGKGDVHSAADWHKLIPDNPTKYLLWQDILLGLFDKNIENLGFSNHYRSIYEELEHHIKKDSRWTSLYEFTSRLCLLLSLKSEMGLKLFYLYQKNMKEELQEVSNKELKVLHDRVNGLKKAHREEWMKNNKPFGWEVLDIRYGGLIARIETTQKRITDYVEGKIECIDELEADKLYYDPSIKKGLGKESKYRRIASANVF
ncbi:beta-N-acetylhexosaminidase [Pseudalkalibacillus decolorationis]|uniref:beta-N-acetylhexosaminidase n=1 Tax=Pseudalkalibacillus decolorationis TaxID=163879 RepID=UPI00214796D3|nr:beta-N-acetylhexosaminidase [Pseudalkalibacillus decolorationis]